MKNETVVRQIPIQMTGYYCLQEPENKYAGPPSVLIALHGFGQKCKGFMRHFTTLANRNILVVAPQGPHQFYMQLDPKKVGFNWLTIYEKGNSIRDFNGFMQRLIDEIEQTHRVTRDRIFLLGFSQGVSMAYRFAVSGEIAPRGLIACCSDLPADVADRLGEVSPFPVLIAHATDDPLILPSKADDAESRLCAAGYPVERLAYTGGHTITEEAVARIGDWIASR
ncbi:MAG: hypothetical protein SGI88_21200 [Candidatus Hydrogenedentes bacterium]|nr:hypothetical protein [Candidatus Hydrogenedentota bacterium]